jgi:hypothetical protein
MSEPRPSSGSKEASPPPRDHGEGGSPILWGALVLVALALVAVIAGGAWMVLRDADTTELPTAIAGTDAATADVAATGVPPSPSPQSSSTPESGRPAPAGDAGTPVPRSGSLPSLLDLAPDQLDEDNVPLPIVASYADLVAWTAVQGMAMPAGPDDPAAASWAGTLDALALPTTLGTRGMEPVWQESYGFALTDVHQVLSVGAAPNSVTIMTGTFDRPTLEDAWVRSGYQAVKIEGLTIWSLFPGDTIDLSARASRPALGSLNNIVLLDDGTLVAAAKLSRLQAVLKVLHGYRSSLAQNDDVRDLVAPLGDGSGVISAEIDRGTLVEAPPTAQSGANATPSSSGTPAATPDASSGTPASAAMPDVGLVLVGLRVAAREGDAVATPAVPAGEPGSSPVAQVEAGRGARVEMIAIFTFVDPDAPVARARSIMTQRLASARSEVTGEPYTHQYRELRLRGASRPGGGTVLVMEAELIDGPADWRRIVETRDLGFAFWEAEP